mgnify:CR=1 FL=1
MARYDDCKYSRIWHLKIQNNIFELTAKRRCNIIISQTLKIESERGINISSEKCDEGTSRFGFNYETRQHSFRNVCFFIVMMISRAGLLSAVIWRPVASVKCYLFCFSIMWLTALKTSFQLINGCKSFLLAHNSSAGQNRMKCPRKTKPRNSLTEEGPNHRNTNPAKTMAESYFRHPFPKKWILNSLGAYVENRHRHPDSNLVS